MDEERIDIPARAPMEVWLAGALMMLLMAFGVWQASAALRDPALSQVPTTLSDISSGVASDLFSKHLDKHLPARPVLIATANAGRYLIFNGTGDEVRLGRDGWLFSVEEIRYEAQSEAWMGQRLDTVARLSKALEQKGVRLVVALLPDKARVQQAQMPSGRYPAWHEQRYGQALKRLRGVGVETVDLWEVMAPEAKRQPLFYRSDTHWNQQGADLAAQAVARRVRELAPDMPAVQYKTETAATTETQVGDLLRMIGLADVPNWLRPDPDAERVQTTVQIGQKVQVGLMDDVSVPVALVGTSYSRRANFHGALRQHLSADVLNVSKDGGGFATAMTGYLKGDEFTQSPPQVLIWEMPERVLSQPLSDAEKQGWPL
jgi:alginate O-acetyltransferase complex protein AlgJ